MAAFASASYEEDGTGLVADEDTWNAIPPPPPPAASLGIHSSREAVEVNFGVQDHVVDADHSDSCTLGSDTMNALGAADVELARSVAQARGASKLGSIPVTDHHHASDAVSSVAEGSLMEQSLREDMTLEEANSILDDDEVGEGCGVLDTSNCGAQILKCLEDPEGSGKGIKSYLLPPVDGPLQGADETVDVDVTQPQLSPSTEAFLAANTESTWEPYGPPDAINERPIAPKPFLRKGSRKEPSSLHRMKERSGKAVENDSSDEKKSLEHLEKMQQDQIEQLERRIARRDEAQREQRRRKQQAKSGQTKQNKLKGESDFGDGGELRHRSPVGRQQGENSSSGEELHIVGDSVKGDEDVVANKTEGPLSASAKPIGRNEGPSNEPMQKRRLPLKSNQKLASSGVDENADQKQRNDEQWQMLKSMRRRQEAALKEAERERETVKAWAASERESVRKWADEQRELIRREKHRASNAAMTSQREKQRQEAKLRAAAAEDQKRSKAEIDALRATVQKFRVEMDGAKAKYRANEKKLKDKIRAQNETIRLLEEKVASLEESASKAPAERSNIADTKTPTAAKAKGTTSKKALATKPEDQKLSKQSSSQRAESSYLAKQSPAHVVEDEAETTGERNKEESSPSADEASPAGNDTGNLIAAGERSGSNDCDALGRGKDMINDLMEEPTEQWLQRLQQRQLPSTIPTDNDALMARANEVVRSCEPKPADALHHKKPYNVNDYIDASPSLGANDIVHGPLTSDVASTQPNSTGRSRTERTCSDKRVVSYRNGTRKEMLADGTTKIHFVNGDVKTTYANQSVVVYYYAAAKTTHVSHGGGLEVFEFPNKQTEKHFPDGKKEIYFPDGTVKVIHPNGSSETEFTDGVRVLEMPDGTKQIIRH